MCCGADCCGEGTLYDEATASCTPVDIQTAGPGPGVDGAVGDDCYTDEECSTESCVFDPPTPDGLGRCSCNPEYKENDGCEGEFQCMTPGEIGAAVGTLISVAPHCKLPVGAKCKTGGECLTTNCDDVTGLCACNTFTHFPCDPKSGGICAFDEVDGYYCDKVVIGDGSLGAICLEAGDCDSNYCNYGMWSMGSGTCTCNPQTNAGCEGDYKCFPDLNALGIADADPLCRLPYNAPCVPGEDNCITFNCDPQTNRCGCDTAVQYPCDRKNDEVCIYSEENGHVCQALTAVSIPVPVDIPAVGDGSKGSTCYSNGDCDSDNCFHGMMWEPGGAGRCQCNPSTNSGCDDGFKCLANLEETQGIADAGPGCYLPYNATCKPGDRCSTGACDEISGRCPCNTFTQYPCDGDEMCVADVNQGHICKVPTVLVPVIDSEGIAIAGGMEAPGQLIEIPDIGMAIPAPDLNEVEVGDGSIGSSCGTNEDCDSGYCNYGFGGRSCTCNPETNAGCDGEYQCSANLIETQRLADAPPACYLPMDATCDPRKYDCLSGVCDKLTNKCACNTFSQVRSIFVVRNIPYARDRLSLTCSPFSHDHSGLVRKMARFVSEMKKRVIFARKWNEPSAVTASRTNIVTLARVTATLRYLGTFQAFASVPRTVGATMDRFVPTDRTFSVHKCSWMLRHVVLLASEKSAIQKNASALLEYVMSRQSYVHATLVQTTDVT